MGAIESIGAAGSKAAELTGRSGGEAFTATLTQMLRDVNQDQLDAAQKAKDLVVDGKGTIHDAVNAMSKAEGSFRLLMEARNRLLEGVNQLLNTRL